MARRWIALSFALAALLVAGVVVWGVIQYNSIDRVGVSLAAAKQLSPQNFLVVGSDTRALAHNTADAGAIFGGKGDLPPAGQRADTIVIARVDPTAKSIQILSVPRDLWVTSTAGKAERINSAYGSGPQELVDVIKKNLGLSINHYVEVNFDGFRGLVEAVGGVPMYFDRPVRDGHTGLRVTKAACINMNGVQALAFARSRYLEYSNGRRWVSDPTGDLGRITRQQIFLRRALAKVTTLNLTDLNTLRELIGVGVQNVKLDDSLGIDDMTTLARQFSKFDSGAMVVHHLTTQPFRTDGGAQVLRFDSTGSDEVIGIFQGRKPKVVAGVTSTTLLSRQSITVDVMNGSGVPGLARQSADRLVPLGFKIGTLGNTSLANATTVSYRPGSEALARRVAADLLPAPKLKADPSVPADHVVIRIAQPLQLSAVGLAARAKAGAPTTAPPAVAGAAAAPTTTAPPTQSTIGLTMGDPPPGVSCQA